MGVEKHAGHSGIAGGIFQPQGTRVTLSCVKISGRSTRPDEGTWPLLNGFLLNIHWHRKNPPVAGRSVEVVRFRNEIVAVYINLEEGLSWADRSIHTFFGATGLCPIR